MVADDEEEEEDEEDDGGSGDDGGLEDSDAEVYSQGQGEDDGEEEDQEEEEDDEHGCKDFELYCFICDKPVVKDSFSAEQKREYPPLPLRYRQHGGARYSVAFVTCASPPGYSKSSGATKTITATWIVVIFGFASFIRKEISRTRK